MKITGTKSGNYIVQNLYFYKPNADYTLTYYTKGDNGNLSVYYSQGGWKTITDTSTGVNADWTLKTVKFNTGTYPGIFIIIKDSAVATVYYDDFKLTADADANATPTLTPTQKPRVTPTPEPTLTPTEVPTATSTPSEVPTVNPTATPTIAATVNPTASPTLRPTATPTLAPTLNPTATATPTLKPTPSPKPVIHTFSVKLNKKTLTIYKGKYSKLFATVLPSNATNKKVSWKSGNNSIVTVSSTGTVKGIKKAQHIFMCTP
ncbi:hypothetical protein D4R99_02105 [bacterium]|nr:MAG: hypothetical protein D4R99_02105 [bacterium]